MANERSGAKLLPSAAPSHPLMVVGRYHDVELSFVLTEEQITNNEAMEACSLALRDSLVKAHNWVNPWEKSLMSDDDTLMMVAEHPIPPNVNLGLLVRRFLASHSMIAIERDLAEELAVQNKGMVVYDTASDSYKRARKP